MRTNHITNQNSHDSHNIETELCGRGSDCEQDWQWVNSIKHSCISTSTKRFTYNDMAVNSRKFTFKY